MNTQDPKNLWLDNLLDVSNPFVYAILLPALALFALNFKRVAIMYFFGAVVFMVLFNEIS